MTDNTQDGTPPPLDLDDVLAEYVSAEEAGIPPDRTSFLARYPQHAEDLRKFFANRDQMRQLIRPLQQAGIANRGRHPIDRIRYFGDYELLEEVAAGGMGIIYKARQASLNRIVAVKMILKGTLAADDEVKRFRTEAEAAANLQHPGIVAIHEVGLHDGQHYFSMDFVDGRSLAEVIRDKPLSARKSAEYLREAAEAVQYAHQQGTLHRDLKPSNIMIDRQDRVRITDFGLAKRIEGNSDLTLSGQILGTPSYMPPEQALGRRSLIAAPSDIYSLGAVLYELLAGRPPFRGESPVETLKQVETLEPVSPRLLNPAITADLNTICLKCLQKEPHKRYGTAQLLADDLGRFLRGETITARPIGRTERSWRWCRRNPLVAALSTGIVALLLVGSLVSTYFAIQASARAGEAIIEKDRADAQTAEAEIAREKAIVSQQLEGRQRERAQEAEAQATEDARRAGIEAEKARYVARFLADMFEQSAPFESGGLRFGVSQQSLADANLTAREILDRGAERVSIELKEQPIVQAALNETMGNVYLALGMTEKADSLLQTALDVRRQQFGSEHLDTASSLHSMGLLRFAQGRYRDSAAAVKEGLAIRRKLMGEDHELVDVSKSVLGNILSLTAPNGRRDMLEAVQLGRESLMWRRRHFGDEHRETAFGMLGLAGALLNRTTGEDTGDETANLMLEATPILLKDPTTKSLGVAISQFMQAEMMKKLGRRDAVLTATRAGLKAVREAVDDEHFLMKICRENATQNFIYCRQFDDAERLCRERLEKLRGGPRGQLLAQAQGALAQVLSKRDGPNDLDEAEKLCQECFALMREYQIAPTKEFLAINVTGPLQSRDFPRAEALYRQAVDLTKAAVLRQREANREDTLDTFVYWRTVGGWARALIKAGRVEEAEALYRDALPLCRQDSDQDGTVQVLEALAEVMQSQARFDEAEQLYRQSFQLAQEMWRQNPELTSTTTSFVQYHLASCLLAAGKPKEAELEYRRVILLNNKVWRPPAEAKLAEILKANH